MAWGVLICLSVFLFISQLEKEEGLNHPRAMTKPVQHLFTGQRGGKQFRHKLEQSLIAGMSGHEAIRHAMEAISPDLLDESARSNRSEIQEAAASL